MLHNKIESLEISKDPHDKFLDFEKKFRIKKWLKILGASKIRKCNFEWRQNSVKLICVRTVLFIVSWI